MYDLRTSFACLKKTDVYDSNIFEKYCSYNQTRIHTEFTFGCCNLFKNYCDCFPTTIEKNKNSNGKLQSWLDQILCGELLIRLFKYSKTNFETLRDS